MERGRAETSRGAFDLPRLTPRALPRSRASKSRQYPLPGDFFIVWRRAARLDVRLALDFQNDG
jgi:hypothetical protein